MNICIGYNRIFYFLMLSIIIFIITCTLCYVSVWAFEENNENDKKKLYFKNESLSKRFSEVCFYLSNLIFLISIILIIYFVILYNKKNLNLLQSKNINNFMLIFNIFVSISFLGLSIYYFMNYDSSKIIKDDKKIMDTDIVLDYWFNIMVTLLCISIIIILITSIDYYYC